MLVNSRSVDFSKWLSRVLSSDSPRSYRTYFCLLLAIVSLLCLMIVAAGMAPIRTMPWDILWTLDNAWRIYQGQIPHADYYNHIGPFCSLLTALGMKLSSPSASALIYGNVILCAIVTPWAWWIVRRRLSPPLAFLFALMMAVALIAPRPLGLPYRDTSYAMLYNRQGFVFLGMLMVALFIPPRDRPSPRRQILSGLSSGILLALLLFCKVSYFGLGILSIGLYLLVFRPSLRWSGALVAGFVLFYAVVKFVFGIDVFLLLQDAAMAGRFQKLSYRLYSLRRIVQNNGLIILAVFLTSFSVLYVTVLQSSDRRFTEIKRYVLVPLALIVIGCLATAGNAQASDIPILFVAWSIIADRIGRETRIPDRKSKKLIVGQFLNFAVMFVFLFYPITIQDMQSVGYSFLWKQFKSDAVAEARRFTSPNLASFIIPEGSAKHTESEGFVPEEYVDKVNDGLRSIARNTNSPKRVFAVDVVNPFPFALGWPSPRDRMSAWWWNFSFSRKIFPSADRVFADVDIVMVPALTPETTTTSEMLYLYGDYIEKHFDRKDESREWTLWMKRSTP